jgi:hypothetical protein
MIPDPSSGWLWLRLQFGPSQRLLLYGKEQLVFEVQLLKVL